MAKKNQLTTSDFLPYEEFERMIDRMHEEGEYFWEMYARLSFCTACRVSDVLKLKWQDILGKQSVTVCEKKTKKPREIPFNPSVQQKFQELYELMDRPDRKDFIFNSRGKDQPVTVQFINQKLKYFKHRYRLKINHFSSHTLRKTFGRYVYEHNNRSPESLILLNKILNHSTIQITKTYIGITKEEVNSIFNSISF